MGGVRELLGLLVGQVRDDDLELGGQLEAALVIRPDMDACTDGGVGDVHLLLPGHEIQRGVEAGGVAGGEQLLGVGALARAAHRLGRGHVEIDSALESAHVAVAAGPGGQGFCGVESLHEFSFAGADEGRRVIPAGMPGSSGATTVCMDRVSSCSVLISARASSTLSRPLPAMMQEGT